MTVDETGQRPDDPAEASSPTDRRRWAIVADVEVLLVAAGVLLDLVIPTLVLLALAAVSLLLRRQGPGSLGLHRPHAAAD